jgi:hypothetical protein
MFVVRGGRDTIPKCACYVLPSPGGYLKIFASRVVIVSSITGASPACACANVHFFFPLLDPRLSLTSSSAPTVGVREDSYIREVARLWIDGLDPELEFPLAMVLLAL